MPDDPSADETAFAPGPNPESSQGDLIAFEFTVFGESGEELGGNVGENPRIFEVGAGEMLPALERELAEVALRLGLEGARRHATELSSGVEIDDRGPATCE